VKRDWIGTVIGPWLVVERFRNAQKKTAYRCLHVEHDKVVGISAQRLGRKIREGAEPRAVDVFTAARARLAVEKDTALREAAR
jgi:hypothetical protein